MTESKVSEYERERLETIRQNREFLVSLNLVGDDAVTVLEGGAQQRKIVVKDKKRRAAPRKEVAGGSDTGEDDDDWGGGTKRRRTGVEPSRQSRRIRGETAEPTTVAEEAVVETGDTRGMLVPAAQYFDASVVEKAIHVDGHYSGWVEEGAMARLGLAANATDAWEGQGGGKFSFKDPLGTGKRLAKRAVPQGQSMAKFVASKLLKKNPNAYFYRHTEPSVEQWTGDWTDEERDIFLRVAREYGCGDKWGLFSTHIPHRVGYQCSNYYRQYVIPEGWIIDSNYYLDGSGHAEYVGKHKRGR
ncbi:hypothetical protein GGF46_001708 [Coemansia sp. RSA 552]|nr:hypothetical protein GGF46_001708 [Coemansia sp. RSA 552]